MGVGEPDSVPAQRQPPSIFAGHDVFNLSNRKFRRWLLPPNENAIALCAQMGLRSLPAEPLTMARYLAVRAGSGASIATLRLASSAITKAHEWAGHESPGKDRGVRASLKGWGRRLAKPQRQAGALTADVLAVIRLTAV